jgi:hypothetical protein
MHRCAPLLCVAFLFSAFGCGVSNPDEAAVPGSDYAGSPTTDDSGSGSGTGTDSDDGGDEGGEMPTDDSGTPGSGPMEEPPPSTAGTTLATGCPSEGTSVYTPFKNFGPVSTGTPATYPWKGPNSYPDTVEDFRAYGPTLPAQVECGANKTVRDYLDVTAGCLKSVMNGGDKRGQIQLTADGYYRSFALPWDAAQNRQVAWGDQGVEYRFFFSSWTGEEGNPGFKAFARYLTEYDLYVGSWRKDGVVQIQKKQCGVYTILARNPNFGPPAPNTWHTIKFQVVGNEQRLYLDGQLAMTTHDDSIKRGTSGIRIDSADGALIDDWKVYAP